MTLKVMLADKDRIWVRELPTPQAHASGVRLFAFRARKKELSCEELAHGRREADGAAKSLRGPEGQGLSPAQISRASMFAAEVSKELTTEMRGPPLQGVSLSAARAPDKLPTAGARAAPTPADDRSRPQVPCPRPTRQAPATRRYGRAPPAAARSATPASSASAYPRGSGRSPARSARNDRDHGEVLRLPASTSGPSMRRTNCASSRISTSCRHGLPLGRLSCVPMMVVEPW